ncbi:MAG TPA: MMPL family transporter [Thermoanaerobaculia bacterium]|jgi:predicted RND superfamily exporter protein|nr:MMPL family transporter [Thermoanaerobaculia bacterium]
MPSLLERIARRVVHRPGRTLAVGLTVTALSLWPASRIAIDTDLSDLLPNDAPAAEDYRTFLRTFGGFEKVFAIVETAETPKASQASGGEPAGDEGLADAARRIAEILETSPEVRAARAGLEEADERFFFGRIAPRLPLLVNTPGWRQDLSQRLEPSAIKARVANMRQALRSPIGGFARGLYAADPLGLTEGLLGAAPAGLPIDPLSGAFLSRDGDAALVVITPARAELDPAAGRAILSAIESARKTTEAETGTKLTVRAIGGPIYAAHDEAILRTDLASTISGSTLGVAAVLLAGFEGVLIPVAITLAVIAGVAWTVGAGALALGSITVVGVGFAAALLGLGVEYGIHGGSRFRLARSNGASRAEALVLAFVEAGPGIVSSALTSAVAVGALAIAHFRPLRELGLLLMFGVLATLATTVLIAAPLLMFGKRERRPRVLLWRAFWQPFLLRTSGFAARRPLPVLAVAGIATLASFWGLQGLSVSVDPRALRPADTPLQKLETIAFTKFGLGLDTSTVVVRRPDLGAALDAAARVREILAARLSRDSAIDSPSDWIVLGNRRARRLAELRALPLERAADDFERELLAAGFRVEPFRPALETLRGFARGQDRLAPAPAEWPDWMSELVRTNLPATPGVPGGAAVAVHLRVPIGALDEAAAESLAADIEREVPGAAFASAPRVGRELRRVASRDLLRSSGFAALLVAIVVLVSLGGRIGSSLLASMPLLLGCLWTFGLWGALGRPLDLVCVAALPVLLGTGIDLGVHAVVGARHAAGGMRDVLLESGPAMTLVMLTASIGFGSLTASRVPGLRNAGLIVAIGGLACLAATLLVLPALDAVLKRPAVEAAPVLPAEGAP